MIACAAFRALRMVPGRHRRWRLWSAARRRWLIKERDRRRASAAGQERLATGPPRRAVRARHSDALDEPDGAAASPGSAHRRQQERSGSPFSASGLVPSGPGSPATGSARPGVPASTCCIGATECPDLGGSNHGAGDSDWAPDRRLLARATTAAPSPSATAVQGPGCAARCCRRRPEPPREHLRVRVSKARVLMIWQVGLPASAVSDVRRSERMTGEQTVRTGPPAHAGLARRR